MFKLTGVLAGLFLAASSAQAFQDKAYSEILSQFKRLSKKYEYVGQNNKGQACRVFVVDLATRAPLNYGITFPEWLYQIYFEAEGSDSVETMIYEDGDTDVFFEESKILVPFNKKDEWTKTDYEFVLDLDSAGKLQSVTMKKLGLLWNKSVVCNF